MNNQKIKATFGSWLSPIAAEDLASSTRRFGHMGTFGQSVYWVESLPDEKGRSTIQRFDGHSIQPALGELVVNARSRVHEMGGGEFLAFAKGIIYCEDSDQRLYWFNNSRAIPLTPKPEEDNEHRFTDMSASPCGNVIVAVRETHAGNRVENDIVMLFLDEEQPLRSIASGFDFFSFPRISPDGGQMLWTCWNHPQMPWDGTELWLADLEQGCPSNVRKIAGGPKESIYQPCWGKDNEIYYISDRSGWWNIYSMVDGKSRELISMDSEFGLPQWIFGTSTYAVLDNGQLVCRYQETDRQQLCVIDPVSKLMTHLPSRFTCFGEYMTAQQNKVYCFASSAETPLSLIEYDLATQTERVLRVSDDQVVDPSFISQPEAIECDTDDQQKTFAFFYPPTNDHYEGEEGELPPLLVLSHGGPTGATHPAYNKAILYWTTRGFAVVDVNYRGSTGYGRDYRDALKSQWGIADVQDCVNMARFLVAKRKVDKRRLAIRGGSAGGYTTLRALTCYDDFSAGMSRYGVADLSLLAKETHKFESRYLDQMVGDYASCKHLYDERSPINHLEQLSCPVLLLQGLEDKIVPPSQAETMVAALDERKQPFAYIAFEGEQHGFRRKETIIRAMEAEYQFYGQVWGFEVPDSLAPLTIRHFTRLD